MGGMPQDGAFFGRYEVLRRLGDGGSAEVFEARHLDLHKRVALKVMRPMMQDDAHAVERALREGRAATSIRHPHVVDILDVGVEGRTPYLVMELLDGDSLAKHLEGVGLLPVHDIVDFLLPVASGVQAAHCAGIIHGDLKPSNILLARRHRGVDAVVVDFGVSRPLGGAPGPSPFSSGPAGTIPYMSPEQVRGTSGATAETDQYALGVILYECATGGVPFWSEDRYELLHSIVSGPVVPPSDINPSVPPQFDALVLRALERDPNARFRSVHELGSALLALGSEKTRARWSAEFLPDGADSTPPVVREASRATARTRVAGFAFVSALCAGVVTVFGQQFASRAPSVQAVAPAAPFAVSLKAPEAPTNTVGEEVSTQKPPANETRLVPPPIHRARHVAPRGSAAGPTNAAASTTSAAFGPTIVAPVPKGANGAPILEIP